MRLIWILTWILITTATAQALEKDYATAWCTQHHGQSEVVLEDGARADCVTKRYAVEVQPAKTWAEAIGQALYYSMALKKKPAVVLIADPEQDYRFIGRLRRVARKYGIKVFLMQPTKEPHNDMANF